MDTWTRRLARALWGSVAAVFLSVVLLFARVFLAAEDPLGPGAGPTVDAPLLGGLFFASMGAVVVSVLAYAAWTVREARREHDGWSPLRHPLRFLSAVSGNSGNLDEYERRLQRAGIAVVVALFFLGALLELLGVAP